MNYNDVLIMKNHVGDVHIHKESNHVCALINTAIINNMILSFL